MLRSMLSTTTRALALLAGMLCACGGGGTGPAEAGNAEGGRDVRQAETEAGDPCEADSTFTVSGALTGTRAAPAAASSWTASNNLGAVAIDAQFGGPFLAAFAFTFAGEPRMATYTESTSGLRCALVVSDPSSPNSGWSASKAGSGATTQGTCALTITSVAALSMLSSLMQYCVHGTVQGSLPVQAGATSTGTVALTVAF